MHRVTEFITVLRQRVEHLKFWDHIAITSSPTEKYSPDDLLVTATHLIDDKHYHRIEIHVSGSNINFDFYTTLELTAIELEDAEAEFKNQIKKAIDVLREQGFSQAVVVLKASI